MAQDTGTPQAEPKKDNTLKIVLIVVAVILLLGVLACAGIIGLGYWGVTQMQEAVASQLAPQLRENPQVVEELGEVESIQFNFMATSELGEQGTMVFDVDGTEGSGRIHAQIQQGTDQIESATLFLPDGREVPLDVSETEREPEGDLQIEMGEEVETAEAEPAEPEPAEATP